VRARFTPIASRAALAPAGPPETAAGLHRGRRGHGGTTASAQPEEADTNKAFTVVLVIADLRLSYSGHKG